MIYLVISSQELIETYIIQNNLIVVIYIFTVWWIIITKFLSLKEVPPRQHKLI